MEAMHSMTNERLSDYKQRAEIENQIGVLLHSHFCEGVTSRRWERRDEVRADLEAIIEKYWSDYRRTPKEQEEFERAIRQW